jgi:hypothetical protein
MSQVWVVVQDMDPLAMVLEQQIRVSWEMQQVEGIDTNQAMEKPLAEVEI